MTSTAARAGGRAQVSQLAEADRCELQRRPFSVGDYYRMAETGVLREDERLELLDGEIVEMSPIGSKHAACVTDLSEWLIEKLRSRAVVRVQNPVRLSDRSEPQPDIAVVRRKADRYRSGHPVPDDILLLVEVSDTTIAVDRDVKLPLYATAGVAEVWIVNLTARHVEVYRSPQAGGYAETHVREGDSTLSFRAFPRLRLPLSAFFA